MIKTSVTLLAVSDQDCCLERLDLTVLMKRAMRIEERMVKGVNLSDEEKRYQILCDRIEYYGQQLADETSANICELSDLYLELLAAALEKEPDTVRRARLTTSFCLKEFVPKRLEALVDLGQRLGLGVNGDWQKAIEFYKLARDKGFNVIELQVVDTESEGEVSVEAGVADKFLSLKVRDDMVADEDKNAFESLRRQIKNVLSSMRSGIPAAVNFSDLRHDVIAEILHEFVYGKGNRVKVPVMYADGSVAAPLLFYSVKHRTHDPDYFLKEAPVLNVGMLSERHPELDAKVKIYWYRNQEISTGKTAAEIDKVAYGKAKELFVKMRDEGVYKIAFYQTGFQPAVVGFYRALTEELIYRSTGMAKLSVTPYYFLGEEYRVGKTWM